MKKIILIKNLLVLLAFLAYGGQIEAKNHSVQKESKKAGAVDLEPSRSLQKIATFTPKELQKRIGKSQPENVRDFFLLIPDTCLFFGGKLEERIGMLQGKPEKYVGILVEVCDEENNYLKLTEFEGKWEMFVQKATAKRWKIIINAQSCAEYCSTIKDVCFYYENGTLFKSDDTLLKKYKDYGLEELAYRNHFSNKEWLAMQKVFAKMSKDKFLFDLPKDGRTLKIYIDPILFNEISDIDSKDLKTIEEDISQSCVKSNKKAIRTKKCFVNEGLKCRNIIEINIFDNGKITGNFYEDEYSDLDEFTIYPFQGKRKGNKLFVSFIGRKPIIGQNSEWLEEPWEIRTENGKEVLYITFYAKNYETNEWEDTEYPFESCPTEEIPR